MTPDEQIKKILHDNNLKYESVITFPNNVASPAAQLALKVLQDEKVVISFQLIENKQ